MSKVVRIEQCVYVRHRHCMSTSVSGSWGSMLKDRAAQQWVSLDVHGRVVGGHGGPLDVNEHGGLCHWMSMGM